MSPSSPCTGQLVSTIPLVLIEYLKGTLLSPSCDTTAVTVGAFIGGAIFGAVTVVLVVGIVCGVFKLRRNTSNRNSKQERLVLLILTVTCVCYNNCRHISSCKLISGMNRPGCQRQLA